MKFSIIFLVSFTKVPPWEEVWLFAWLFFMLFTQTHSFHILVCGRGSHQHMNRSGWWSCISGGWKSKAEDMKDWFSLSTEGGGLSLYAFGSSWSMSWANASCWVVRCLHPDLARKDSTFLPLDPTSSRWLKQVHRAEVDHPPVPGNLKTQTCVGSSLGLGPEED